MTPAGFEPAIFTVKEWRLNQFVYGAVILVDSFMLRHEISSVMSRGLLRFKLQVHFGDSMEDWTPTSSLTGQRTNHLYDRIK